MCILHTVVPLEIVLAGVDQTPWAGPAERGQPPDQVARGHFVPLGGGRFAELEAGPQGPVLRRLVSPVPADYLDPRLQPGVLFEQGFGSA